MREADILLHVVDISHPNFEDHINVVRETLKEIGAGEKTTLLIFNKIDAFTYEKKDEDDLTPVTKRNLSMDDLKKTWMGSLNGPCIFISAQDKINLDELKSTVYKMVKEMHVKRYPYNNLLY